MALYRQSKNDGLREEEERAEAWLQELKAKGLTRYRVLSDKGFFVDLAAASKGDARLAGQKWFDDRDGERACVGAPRVGDKAVSVEEIK